MIILGVDSSSAAGSAAVSRDGELLYEAYANEGLTHSQTLLVRCDEAIRAGGISPGDVDVFAVTSGPGSFTGLRIGMGLIKGMAFATGAKCAGVSTFLALAEPLKDSGRDILTVLDARQRRAYCAAYRSENGELKKVMDECVLPFSELNNASRTAGLNAPLVVGDISAEASSYIDGAEYAGDDMRFVHARYVCEAAGSMAEKGQLCSAEELRPFYLQLSQAERNRIQSNREEKQT
ncbi:MAG: tRNA (adenosine(37)-N6)-threonylcarbamoyltransferase complex dimerization subunit type 1 TsaB [Oscillospiraceae bacterium]|nr:tRNA (adenosine(37)-N6)-threonylcarbamoyltransferase complex dimerization subunit type 1 TsaB [Oscillospiraceae bacterium]